MPLTMEELSRLNRWIAAKIRWEIADTSNRPLNPVEVSHYAREMHDSWMDLCKLTDSPSLSKDVHRKR